MPKIIPVDQNTEGLFYEYCARHGGENDGSFLPGRDFEISVEHPSYLLLDEGLAAGAVSLMRTERFLSAGKGRFSIFHARSSEAADYERLLNAIRPHIQGLRSVYLFIPEARSGLAGILEGLGFRDERYSFILERSGPPLPAPVFPAGVSVHALTPEDLDGISQFAECINEEFKDLAGHMPSSAETIQEIFQDQAYIEGGLCLLKAGEEAIGTISMAHDLENMAAGEIMAFGIVEKHRGKALGRNLLRYGFNFLISRGLNPVTLSVNGDNHGAIRLYESEGFMLTESVICYSLEGIF